MRSSLCERQIESAHASGVSNKAGGAGVTGGDRRCSIGAARRGRRNVVARNGGAGGPEPGWRKRSKRDYLLIPGIPTPNGPFHLGHIAGPFLRMDALARYRRMRGDRAVVISGTDAFETHVLLKAVMTG